MLLLIIILSITVLLLIVAVVVFWYLPRRFNPSAKLTALERRARLTLSMPIKHHLARLEMIATGQEELVKKVEEAGVDYSHLEQRKEQLLVEIEETMTLVIANQTSREQLVKQVRQLEIDFNNLYVDYQVLNMSLVAMCDKENTIRIQLQSAKEEYRFLKKTYLTASGEILVMPSYEEAFNEIDQLFLGIDELLAQGEFSKALEKANQADKKIDYLGTLIRLMAPIIASALNKMTVNYKKCDDYYRQLLDEGYQVGGAPYNQIWASIKETLALLRSSLDGGDYPLSVKLVDQFTASIDDLTARLVKEESARKLYQDELQTLFNKKALIHHEFVALKRLIDNSHAIYQLPSGDIVEFTRIAEKLQRLDQEHQKLTSSSSAHPTNSQVLIAQALIKEIAADRGDVEKLKTTIESYRVKVETIFHALELVPDQLCQVLIEATRTGVDEFAATIAIRVEDFHKRIAQIRSFLRKTPINLEPLFDTNDHLHRELVSLREDVETKISLLASSRAQIIKGNRYRLIFQEADRLLADAEEMISRGDFASSYRLSKMTLDKFAGEVKV